MNPRVLFHNHSKGIVVIPLNDLSRRIIQFDEELKLACARVLQKGRFILGHEVKSFEAEFAAYCGVQHAIGVGNGTDALELTLRALEIGPGDSVAAVANAGGYSTTAIRGVGAQPVYVDIDPTSMTMSPDELENTLSTTSVNAVIVTHLYGQLADMDGLLKVADARQIPMIEDCAQAHGASRNGKRAGSWGKLAAFSFYPTKNLGALGDGGAVLTDDPDLAQAVTQLREYGWSQKYRVTRRGGLNSRLDEFQAAFLRIFLPHLDAWNQRRREIFAQYNRGLSDLDLIDLELILPSALGTDHVGHLYVIQISMRQKLRDFLTANGIGHDIHYPIPDHLQPTNESHFSTLLRHTEAARERVLSLPCFPELTNEEIDIVIGAVRKAVTT